MLTTPPSPKVAPEWTASSPPVIEGDFEDAFPPVLPPSPRSRPSAPPPQARGVSWTMMVSSLLLVALVAGAGAALWIYLHQPEQGQARAADEKTLSEKTPTIDVSGLPASRIAVVDIGAITVAWGTGGGTDASAVALKLKQTFDRLAQSGVVVVESRYSLASPPSVDITAQVATSVGVDLKALLAVPATAYSNPVTPTVVEGTGWRVGAPPAAHAPTPGAPVATRNPNPSATKKN